MKHVGQVPDAAGESGYVGNTVVELGLAEGGRSMRRQTQQLPGANWQGASTAGRRLVS